MKSRENQDEKQEKCQDRTKKKNIEKHDVILECQKNKNLRASKF
jgi:hypothetical protein